MISDAALLALRDRAARAIADLVSALRGAKVTEYDDELHAKWWLERIAERIVDRVHREAP